MTDQQDGLSRDGTVASELEAKPVEWLWRDRIPKGVITVVAGRPDQGKGLFASLVAAEVTKMGRNVIYSAIEDDPARMTRPRLEAAGARLDQVLIYRFTLPDMLGGLEARVMANDAALVVIDPLAAHLGGGVSRHTDSIRKVTNPLSELAEATGCSFLIVEHALKRVGRGSDPLNAIGGTGSGLPAAARMAYLFGCDPKDGDRRLLASVKSNLRERPKALAFDTDTDELEEVGTVPFLLPQEETDADASLLLGPSNGKQPGRPPDKRAAAAEWLALLLYEWQRKHGGASCAKTSTKYPQGQGLPTAQVYKDGNMDGITRKTIRRAADDMGVIRTPSGGGPKVKWTLPPDTYRMIHTAKGGGSK